MAVAPASGGMTPGHHPYPETLMSYASGTLPGAVACVVSCHLSLCRDCAEQVRWLEKLGGVMLRSLETSLAGLAISEISVQRQPRLDDRPPAARVHDLLLPAPLRRHLGAEGGWISWRPAAGGIEERAIALAGDAGSIRLLRLSPGQALPRSGFGPEAGIALMLQGTCRDESHHYARGDMIEWAESMRRPPVASGASPCVCLLAEHASA